MNRMFRTSVALATVLFALASLSACSSKDTKEAQKQAERAARLGELQQQKQDLETARQNLAQMKESLEQAKNGETAEGEKVDVDQLQVDVNKKESQVAEMADSLNQALVEYINDGAPVAGEQPGPNEQQALHMKADEDMILAKEYITEGGEYARAIGIYQDILKFDPNNQKVKDAMAQAEADRYMDEERFSQVKKGMNEDQVSALLGPANSANRRTYPKKKLVAWFYPKSAEGDAAAVYMRQKGEHYEVYETKFNAVAKRAETGGDDSGS